MTINEELGFSVFPRQTYGARVDYEIAVDALAVAARFALYDDLRPGRVHNQAKNGWLAHERSFAVLVPPQEDSRERPWMSTPARLVRRTRGEGARGYAIHDQFALQMYDRGVILAWNARDDKVLCDATGLPRTYLLRQAIIDTARLMTSPLFINYDPNTGEFEDQMPTPYPDEPSHFPIGSIKEAIAACQGIASFVTRATEVSF